MIIQNHVELLTQVQGASKYEFQFEDFSSNLNVGDSKFSRHQKEIRRRFLVSCYPSWLILNKSRLYNLEQPDEQVLEAALQICQTVLETATGLKPTKSHLHTMEMQLSLG